MFRSYSNISTHFLRDYGTIAMVIILVTMVTITTVISSRVKIYILLDVLLCSIAEHFYELCRILASP